MVHTDDNEKKKDNKEVKKKYSRREIFHFKRNDKSRYTREFQKFQK